MMVKPPDLLCIRNGFGMIFQWNCFVFSQFIIDRDLPFTFIQLLNDIHLPNFTVTISTQDYSTFT